VAKEAKKVQIENPIKNCVSHTLADITKTRDALGYNPKYSLEEGIRELI
jgi:nucleoside-diphosphate-sugar epimerase